MEAIALKKILLADDDADDCSLFKEALAEVFPEGELSEVKDGMELIEVLSKENPDILFFRHQHAPEKWH